MGQGNETVVRGPRFQKLYFFCQLDFAKLRTTTDRINMNERLTHATRVQHAYVCACVRACMRTCVRLHIIHNLNQYEEKERGRGTKGAHYRVRVRFMR